jgi:hypothetical protein
MHGTGVNDFTTPGALEGHLTGLPIMILTAPFVRPLGDIHGSTGHILRISRVLGAYPPGQSLLQSRASVHVDRSVPQEFPYWLPRAPAYGVRHTKPSPYANSATPLAGVSG